MIPSKSLSFRLSEGLAYTRLGFLLAAAFVLFLAILQILWSPFKFTAAGRTSDTLLNSQKTFVPLKPLENLTQDFSSHSLFYLPRTEEAVQGPGMEDALQAFRLIGVVQGEKPEALIKNQINEQTYFARAGEKFDQFKVTAIHAESIVVEYEGETKEMPLEGGFA